MKCTQESPYFSLRFHGFQATPSMVKHCYQLALELHSEAGNKVAHIGVTAKGSNGKLLDFPTGHRRMQRIDFASVVNFCTLADDSANAGLEAHSPAAFYFSRQITSYGSDHSYVTFTSLKKDREWLASAGQRLCQVLCPVYGIGYERIVRFGIRLSDWINDPVHRAEKWASADWEAYWAPWGVYRYGYLRDVFEMNFLSQPFLQRTIEGMLLLDWIAADFRRGLLTRLTEEVVVWRVEPDNIPAIRESVLQAQLLCTRENPVVMQLMEDARKKCFDERTAAERKPDRKKLIALLRLLDERSGPEHMKPLVTLEEFFPGNTIDKSIAANLTPHPGLKRFRDVLKRIRAKDTVQDVLILITDRPMTPETDDADFEDDDWPYSDAVFVLTSSSPAEVEKWAVKLQPDSVTVAQWDNNQPPKDAPELQPGMQLIRLWWD